jgi:hypothetical protein
MSNVTTALSTYASDNPTDTYDIVCVDGTTYLGAGMAEVLDNGLLIFSNMPDTAPRLYIPLTAIVSVKVTGVFVNDE